MEKLNGKIALVTGAGSGIGRATSLKFAENGMDIAIADVDEDAGKETANLVQSLGQKAIVIKTDVSDRSSVEYLAIEVIEKLGVPHILFNNAGVVMFKNIVEMTSADWSWVMGVNLDGVINGISVFIPHMVKARNGGHIINTASTAGLFGYAGLTSYCASKFAVVGLSEHLRRDLEPYNIGVSVLCPGQVDTNIISAGRNRPDIFGGPEEPSAIAKQVGIGIAQGVKADFVGKLIVNAVKENAPFILTHPDVKKDIENRLNAIRRAFKINA